MRAVRANRHWTDEELLSRCWGLANREHGESLDDGLAWREAGPVAWLVLTGLVLLCLVMAL